MGSYKLMVFAEQCNEDFKTDLASGMVSIPITVAVAVTGVTVSPEETELRPGDKKQLTATVEPEDATNKDVTWSSDRESVATVDENGKVTAVSEGEAIITVTTDDGDKTATCKVTVKKDAPVTEECTITFKANGGKGDMKPQTADKGENIKLRANDFTRNGYEFKNWNTEVDGSGDKYDDEQSLRLEEDLTLYAQWREKADDDDDTHYSCGVSESYCIGRTDWETVCHHSAGQVWKYVCPEGYGCESEYGDGECQF